MLDVTGDILSVTEGYLVNFASVNKDIGELDNIGIFSRYPVTKETYVNVPILKVGMVIPVRPAPTLTIYTCIVSEGALVSTEGFIRSLKYIDGIIRSYDLDITTPINIYIPKNAMKDIELSICHIEDVFAGVEFILWSN